MNKSNKLQSLLLVPAFLLPTTNLLAEEAINKNTSQYNENLAFVTNTTNLTEKTFNNWETTENWNHGQEKFRKTADSTKILNYAQELPTGNVKLISKDYRQELAEKLTKPTMEESVCEIQTHNNSYKLGEIISKEDFLNYNIDLSNPKTSTKLTQTKEGNLKLNIHSTISAEEYNHLFDWHSDKFQEDYSKAEGKPVRIMSLEFQEDNFQAGKNLASGLEQLIGICQENQEQVSQIRNSGDKTLKPVQYTNKYN